MLLWYKAIACIWFMAIGLSMAAPNSTKTDSKDPRYTLCSDSNIFTPTNVTRKFNAWTRTYSLIIHGSASSNISFTTDSTGLISYAPASRLQIQVGLQTVFDQTSELCTDAKGGCPIIAGKSTEIHKTVTVPWDIVPFGDVIAHYNAWTTDQQTVLCLDGTPIAYFSLTWRYVYTFVPVAIAIFSALVAFIATVGPRSHGESNLTLLLAGFRRRAQDLRIMSPSFVDVILFCQFIVTLAQLNLNFPRFYQYYASNFAWSYLITPTTWLNNAVSRIFPNDPLPGGVSVTSSPGSVGFAHSSTIDPSGQFLTALVFFLIVTAAVLLAALLFLVFAQSKLSRQPTENVNRSFGDFIIGILLRLVTLFFLPLVAYSFYQFMQTAPWYLMLLAAFVLAVPILFFVSYASFQVMRVRPSSLLYTQPKLVLRYGALFNDYREEKRWFFIIDLVCRFIIGMMIGLLQSSGLAQGIILVVIEVVYLVIFFTQCPYADKVVNAYQIVLASVRAVISVLHLVFIDQMNVTEHDRQCIAYVEIVLTSVIFLVLFVILIRNIIVLAVGRDDYQPQDLHPSEFMESDGLPRKPMWRQLWESKLATEQASISQSDQFSMGDPTIMGARQPWEPTNRRDSFGSTSSPVSHPSQAPLVRMPGSTSISSQPSGGPPAFFGVPPPQPYYARQSVDLYQSYANAPSPPH